MRENSFRELLLLDLSVPHDKSQYSLKRNQFIIRSNGQKAHFDSMYPHSHAATTQSMIC